MGRSSRYFDTPLSRKNPDTEHLAELRKYGFPTNNSERLSLSNRIKLLGAFAIKGVDMALVISDILTGDREPQKLAWGIDDITGEPKVYDRTFMFDRQSDQSWLGFAEIFPRITKARGIYSSARSFSDVLQAPQPVLYASCDTGRVLVAQTVDMALVRQKIPEAYPNPASTIVLTTELVSKRLAAC